MDRIRVYIKTWNWTFSVGSASLTSLIILERICDNHIKMMPPWHRLTDYAIIFKCCNWNLLLSAYCHFSIPLKASKPLLPLLYEFNAMFCTQKELVFHQEHFVYLKCCENTGLVNTAGYKSILENDSAKKKKKKKAFCHFMLMGTTQISAFD